MNPPGRAVVVTVGVGLVGFCLPGVYLLGLMRVPSSDSPPNWALALGGTLFTLFGAMVAGAAACQYWGANWRKLALAGMMLALPATAALLAWPALQITIPIGQGRTLLPGGPTTWPADLNDRLILGAASGAFALGSVALWWLVLTGRVSPDDVRGLAEE